MKFLYPAALCFSLFISCHRETTPIASSSWQLISGRNGGKSVDRPLIYRALVPANWIRKDPLLSESIADTTKSICEFYIQENGEQIRITFHTFPIHQHDLRISPHAQVARWKRQFEQFDHLSAQIHAVSHGGFSGLQFEGLGTLQGGPIKVMGWSMQLASGYERQLSQGRNPLDYDKRADYTIKASGPPSLMDRYRSSLLAFADSFELIDELPSP
jgi:hypothetical protein